MQFRCDRGELAPGRTVNWRRPESPVPVGHGGFPIGIVTAMTECLSNLTMSSAQRFGARTAVSQPGCVLSFADLAERSRRVAQSLIHLGVRRGECVGIHQPQTVRSLIAVHGVLSAGAAYVPVDPQLPAARAAAILDRCGVKVTFSGGLRRGLLADTLAYRSRRGIVVGSESSGTGEQCAPWCSVVSGLSDAALPQVREADTAYVIFTSGSTGDPKGIVHTHGSAMAYAQAAAGLYGLVPEDRIAGIAPLHFDQSTFHLFSAPLAGARSCLVSDAQLRMPASLVRQLAGDHVTVLYTVPYQLVQLITRGGLASDDLDSLRWVLFGGEPFPVQHLKAWMARFPNTGFSNVYGPAEVNQCTFFNVPRDADPESVPVGWSWPAANVLVVDDRDAAVPPGQAGELLVNSATMMDRYWEGSCDDPAVFAVRPGLDGAAVRYFRTGDRFRQDGDGCLWFLGRMDRQVKLRGQRLDLEGVEALLRGHADVAEAAVFLVMRDGHREVLEAAVIPAEGKVLTAVALRKYLALSLPAAAIPEHVDIRSDFPRTGSDKIDRRALAQDRASAPA